MDSYGGFLNEHFRKSPKLTPVNRTVLTSGCPATGGVSDGDPQEDEKGEGDSDPEPDPQHQLALPQLSLGWDFLLNELELRLLESLHSLVNCRAGPLLVDRNHCHHVGLARVKVF